MLSGTKNELTGLTKKQNKKTPRSPPMNQHLKTEMCSDITCLADAIYRSCSLGFNGEMKEQGELTSINRGTRKTDLNVYHSL
jgi:hypothetical protein